MAKNKKPRKSYKARPVHCSGCFYPREWINEIKDILNKIGLVAEIVLPRGTATDDQMHQLQDLLNWGGMLMFDRKLLNFLFEALMLKRSNNWSINP